MATTGAQRPPRKTRAAPRRTHDREPGPLAVGWFAVAAAAAVLAGWLTGPTGTADLRTPVVLVLLVAALVGVLPVGRFARLRAVTAPAFAGAAAYALLWDPDPLHLPTIVGGAALAAAVTAAVARALAAGPDEGLVVWIVAGSVVFVVPALAALVGGSPALVWSVLLLVAMLASRFVPMLAVDVPDHHLVDVERLAASAWSARETPRGRRGRTVVSLAGVAAVAGHGARTTTAACAAIAAVTVVVAPQLLATAADEVDRIGARCMVFFVGASLLLVARSYRHVAARALLRTAGLFCWAVLAWELLAGPAADRLVLVAAVAGGLAVLVLAGRDRHRPGLALGLVVATRRGRGVAGRRRRDRVDRGVVGALPGPVGADVRQRSGRLTRPGSPASRGPRRRDQPQTARSDVRWSDQRRLGRRCSCTGTDFRCLARGEPGRSVVVRRS